jgi:hypothetical protein
LILSIAQLKDFEAAANERFFLFEDKRLKVPTRRSRSAEVLLSAPQNQKLRTAMKTGLSFQIYVG